MNKQDLRCSVSGALDMQKNIDRQSMKIWMCDSVFGVTKKLMLGHTWNAAAQDGILVQINAQS